MSAADDWIRSLLLATVTIETAGAPLGELTATSLRLAWMTAEAVDTPDSASYAHWRGFGDDVANAAARLDRHLAPPGVQLGTGPGPSEMLPDSAELRVAVLLLAEAGNDAFDEHVFGPLPGGRLRRLGAHAQAGVALSLHRPDLFYFDGLDRQVLYQPELPLRPPGLEWR